MERTKTRRLRVRYDVSPDGSLTLKRDESPAPKRGLFERLARKLRRGAKSRRG
jgi:hypothetical protein